MTQIGIYGRNCLVFEVLVSTPGTRLDVSVSCTQLLCFLLRILRGSCLGEPSTTSSNRECDFDVIAVGSLNRLFYYLELILMIRTKNIFIRLERGFLRFRILYSHLCIDSRFSQATFKIRRHGTYFPERERPVTLWLVALVCDQRQKYRTLYR